MKFLVANSNISSNVGNAFFYLGVEYALKKIIPNAEVIDGYFSPLNAYGLKGKERTNNFDYFGCVGEVDAIVIAGPVLDKNFGFQFEAAMTKARSLGVKIFLISSGGREYSEEEIAHCREVLGRVRPDVFISRDSETYENYNDLCSSSYDGLCFAFFIGDYYQGYTTSDIGRYVVSCFDFAPEVDLEDFVRAYEDGSTLEVESHTTRSFFNKIRYSLQRKFPLEVMGYRVLRACHRPLRHKRFVFFKPDMLSSFTAGPYLNLYKNASLTITDRLHAAVATLSMGGAACLVLSSNRTRLLDRAGVSACVNNVYSMPEGYLDTEKELQLEFLKKRLDDLCE